MLLATIPNRPDGILRINEVIEKHTHTHTTNPFAIHRESYYINNCQDCTLKFTKKKVMATFIEQKKEQKTTNIFVCNCNFWFTFKIMIIIISIRII